MPTEVEFRSAAFKVGRLEESFGVVAGTISSLRGETGLIGGRVSGIVDESIDVSFANALTVDAGLAELRTWLLAQAALCSDYTSSMNSWYFHRSAWNVRNADHLSNPDAYDPPGRLSGRPTRPQTWIEAG